MASVYSGGTTTNVGGAPTGNSVVNALIGGTKWGGGGLGTSANVTFSFPTDFSVTSGFLGFNTGSFDYSGEAGTGQALSVTQQNATRSALQKWANVANINFTEIADTPDTAVIGDNSSVGDLRFAESNSPSTAWAYYPGGGPRGGDVWFNKTDYNTPVAGDYAYDTFMHEIGHALGLEHPHENDDGDTMASGTDAVKYSIMSYRDHVGDALDGYEMNYYPTTPMLYDVLAMQTLYGTNWNHNSGNNTYSWAAGAKVFECIWDGGGNDTLSAANQTQGTDLHLTSGIFSSIGDSLWNGTAWVRDNLVIAFNANIENATGSDYNDTIFGNTGANVLRGNGGDDTLRGSEWADHLTDGSDTMYGGAGNDFMGGHNGNDSMHGESGNDSVIGDGGDDYLTGGTGDDWVVGDYTDGVGNGNDTMYGDDGADTMEGGTGNDYMVGGNNTSWFDGLFLHVADNSRDVMYGQDGNDTMYGGAGNDYMDGGVGNDNVYGQNGDDEVYDYYGNNYLDGGEGNDYLSAGSGSDTMVGGNGNDTLVGGWNGGVGDWMEGGAGDDTYHVDAGDTVVETASAGIDTVFAYSNNYTLTANVETLTLTEIAGVLNGTGNTLGNTINGNGQNNTLDGGLGADVMRGGNGDDTLWGAISTATADSGDTIYGEAGNDVIGGSYGADVLDGGVGDDRLYGDEGNDIVRGGDGDDLLRGDWGWGSDLNGADTLEGGNGNDLLYGGAAGDSLEGGAGNDLMDGGTGSDTASYNAAIAGVVVNLSLAGAQNTVGAGVDTLVSMENLTGSTFNDVLTGTMGINIIKGNAGNDTLNGGAGDDVLDGGSGDDIVNGQDGNDTLTGGIGNDTLNGGLGTDTASYSSASAGVTVNLSVLAAQNTVGAGVDTLAGVENITGSAFVDVLAGDAGANVLNGGAGNDSLFGRDGNDRLIGGSGNDAMDGGTGTDTADYATAASGVSVNLSNTLAQNTVGAGTDTLSNIENLIGSAYADSLTGSAVANAISGGGGNDTMFGGAGNDSMNGGLGNDVMRGDEGNDVLAGGGGNDRFDWAAIAFNSADVVAGGVDSITDSNAGDMLDFSASLEMLLQVNGTSLAGSLGNILLGNAFNANTNVCYNANALWFDLDNSQSISANDFHVQLTAGVASLTYNAASDMFLV